MEVGDLATWGSVVVSIGFGLAGFCVALRSNKRAKQAVEKADAANQLAAAANTISEDANRIAVEANEIAQDSHSLGVVREARENERYDVRWDGGWKEPGVYRYVNVGDDEAFNVRAVVTVGDFEGKATAESVSPGRWVDIDMPEVKQEYAREQALKRHLTVANDPRLTMGIVSPLDYMHGIYEFVRWDTKLGNHFVHESHNMGGTYG